MVDNESNWSVYGKLSKGPDKKERTNHDDYVGMQKGAYFKKNVLFSLLHFWLV